MTHLINYHITSNDLAGHRYSVRLTISKPHPDGQLVSLPTWIPGSYLIRDFSRHIETIQASNALGSLSIQKIDNSRWQVAPSKSTIYLEYQVYAWDLSVRGAHLDESHGFFNGTSVFLQVDGQEDQPCLIEIARPKQSKNWQVYTSLPIAKDHRKAAKNHQFGMYQAPNYDALIDHPIEMGTPAYTSFTAGGVLHELVFTGIVPNIDLERIARDSQAICNASIQLFDPKKAHAPFTDSSDRYTFLVMVTENDYGGLEHRSSTALMTGRNTLPVIGQDKQTPEYRRFLGLVSHEYFHSWNVKRIKPAIFTPYQLQHATPTRLLWIFEGFTSYYDDLILRRSGLISEQDYLSLVSDNMNNVFNSVGQYKQTVADSSFDAWTKFYKQDENAGNAIVSYYTKGALIALCLDLFIRTKTKQKSTLDDVMRYLWLSYGQHYYRHKPKGLEENEFARIVQEVTGLDITDFLKRYVYGLDELPLVDLLGKNHFLVKEKLADKKTPVLNIRTKALQENCQLTYVQEHGVAHKAKLSAGDVLVAIDGIRVTHANLNDLLNRYQPLQTVAVHAFRRDELRLFKVKLEADTKRTFEISSTKKVRLW